MLIGIKSKLLSFLQAIAAYVLSPPPPPHVFSFCPFLERLVAASGPNHLDDVLLCASLLQRAAQHFRAVSLLARFPDAACSARGKIVLAQSHAALGDWDSVKVVAVGRMSRLGLTLFPRLYCNILVMLAPSVFCYQVSSKVHARIIVST